MIFFKVDLGGSICITWLIPEEIEPELMTAMSDPDVRKFFAQTNIRTVVVDGKPLYNEEQTSLHESDSNSEERGEDVTPTPQRKKISTEAVKPESKHTYS